jgi:ABC-2 type transport system ATP-binding protein
LSAQGYAVEARNLVKVYGRGSRRVEALKGVSLRVPRGVVAGLFGHNGAGKTTLFNILVGIILPTSGEARVLGVDPVRESVRVRELVGYMPEGLGFYPDMTGRENLRYLAALDGLPRNKAEERVGEVLELVDLVEVADRRVSTYSRGMLQRLGLAQALLKDPELLLLDEPTLGLDPSGTRDFKAMIERLAGSGKTILISTHLLNELGPLCRYGIVIREGRVLAEGYREEVAKGLQLGKSPGEAGWSDIYFALEEARR